MVSQILDSLSRIADKITSIERQSFFRKSLMWIYFVCCIPFAFVVAANIFVYPPQKNDTEKSKPVFVSTSNLIATTIQLLSLVGVTSILVVGHRPITAFEGQRIEALRANASAIRQRFAEIEKALNETNVFLETGPKPVFSLQSLEFVVNSRAIWQGLQQSVKKKITSARLLVAKSESCLSEVRDLESKVDELIISRERVVFGIGFAIMPCLSSIAVMLNCISVFINDGSADGIQLRHEYFAMAPACTICAFAAYGLLGRRKTSEAQFMDDLRNAALNIQLLEQAARKFPV